ncbi:TlpA family protein disulfide reductase [Seonamhaeicola marinus]|uniref:TlpA family protein disulfide reductase n=1 Tax=Seonamhaeicola marinus TaxID=1912246 RepID=A0A5D0J961_9FLAO|nr:TlpA disulfide reductase family protein [Seonamhaeicola marinus]TYA92089.1 TlpA family protein disulfide reductase [Seonamhaeicola marinus]
MKNRKLITSLILAFCSLIGFSQIKLSEQIQMSKSASQESVSLYFIDFWATWCGPCISASKYLTVLQSEYPNDLHIVSLSQENPDLVKAFLKKHDLKLTAAIDNEGETFKKYKVHSLPYGVLLNANGAKIWEGHPADLKSHDINNYLRKYKTRSDYSAFFEVLKYEIVNEEQYTPEKAFEFKEIVNVENDGLQIENEGDYVEIKGRLNEILAYGWKVNSNQVKVKEEDNKFYSLYFKKNSRGFRNMSDTIVRKLKLKNKTKKSLGEVYVLDFSSATLWDTFQIDWTDNPTRYLIGTADIKADNLSVKDISYLLGKALETPVVLKNVDDYYKLHDWDIHFKYYDLMVSSLNDNYGIRLQKEKSELISYNITKKAP